MTPDQQTSPPELIEWREAAKLSWLRIPAVIGLAGTLILGFNLVIGDDHTMTIGPVGLDWSDALCIFATLLLTTFPVWYYVTGRIRRSGSPPALGRQLAACLGLLIFAMLVLPTFKVEYRELNPGNDITTTWIKRSMPETLAAPWVRYDELAWLQSNFSAAYIPADVACPRYSTRLFPLFGMIRDDYLANALAYDLDTGANFGSDPNSDSRRPPADALAAGIARCRVEGPAMRAAGHTKESALMQGDIDRFFALDAMGHSPHDSIVLEDAEIPAPIMNKINAFLATEPDTFEYLQAPGSPGEVRRLRPILVAAALGRDKDVARLRAEAK
jgi:hypothetical protein